MDEKDIYTGKTVEEAVAEALAALNISEEQAEITVIDEGKKKRIGGTPAKVKVVKKLTDGGRAVEYVEGLLEILGVNAVAELVSDGEKIEINLTATESSKIIGRHGDVLDAIQTLAGAVANIGNEQYKKVVVDCENYRESREKTLTELALRLANKAVEKGRRVTLEPMNPYERRIIHSALSESREVKTVSSGKEPSRFVVIIPNNEVEGSKPYAVRGGRDRDNRRGGRDDRRRKGNGGGRRGGSSGSSSGRAKKEIHFGTFLGNSGNSHSDD